MQRKNIKLKDIKPNPFKKEINGGKLNKEQVNSIKANIKKLGLMGSLPVVKKEGKYLLVNGHHRLEALKQVYGQNFEVEVDVKDYSEDNLFRGMVVENLTQRSGEYRELKDNVIAIRKYLKEHKEILASLRDTRKHSEKLNVEFKDKPTSQDIISWLDGTGKVITHDEVTELLNINDKLSPQLEKKVTKKHDKTKEERDNEDLNYTQAVLLSRFDNKKEQEDLAEALQRSREQRVREQGKLLTSYKEASEETKKGVRDGTLNLEDVPIENMKEIVKQRMEQQKEKDKGKIIVTHYKKIKRDIENHIGSTNFEINKTCAELEGLDKAGVLQELEWKDIYNILDAIPKAGKKYTKLGEDLMGRL